MKHLLYICSTNGVKIMIHNNHSFCDSHSRSKNNSASQPESLARDTKSLFDSIINSAYDYLLHNEKSGVCCICGKPYHDYGNNAMPLMNGRCCKECNEEFVIPSRISLRRKGINFRTIDIPLCDYDNE